MHRDRRTARRCNHRVYTRTFNLPTQPKHIIHLVSLANYLQSGLVSSTLGAGSSSPGRLCSAAIPYLPVICVLGSCGCSHKCRITKRFHTAPLKTRTGFNESPVPYCFVSSPPLSWCHGTAHSVDRGLYLANHPSTDLDNFSKRRRRLRTGRHLQPPHFEHSRWVLPHILVFGLSIRSSNHSCILLTPLRSSRYRFTGSTPFSIHCPTTLDASA